LAEQIEIGSKDEIEAEEKENYERNLLLA